MGYAAVNQAARMITLALYRSCAGLGMISYIKFPVTLVPINR
jgi:hypothetical protein